MNDSAHHEKHLEAYVVSKLAQQGWHVGTTREYDTEYALYPSDLESWIKTTQPKKWEKLVQLNGSKAIDVLMDRLAQQLNKDGTVQVLRNGLKIAGCGEIDLSEGLPEDDRDKTSWERYQRNRLRVVPQLKYHPARELAIDLVCFVNGLPVATIEIKTDFTQSADAAVEQYKKDRKPYDEKTRRAEPLLTFKRGAVVHFAMSDSEIRMATQLAGEDTLFLPFNKGNNGHAGNPARPDGEYPIAYFWEEVCQKDAWLRIFHSFVYVEKKDVVDLAGNWSRRETQIFPRFHQWDAVNKMLVDAKANGPGQAYLCEHSAGSGKTSTIAWTAHDLIKLRKPDGTAIFDTVIVVTDRTVLDSQLQDAVRQIDHQKDLIAAITKEIPGRSKTQQLLEALQRKTPIIVVTIQTFPYAMEAILTDSLLKDRNFAVIIDEAHSSQTGASASKLQAALAMGAGEEDIKELTVEELLERIQKSRVRPKNVSHFAFTATPKHSTMMLFGRPKDPTQPASKDNLPQSFHRYPMRQAIEEGFILDVLQGYTPYKTAFNLSEQIIEGKRVGERSAKLALAKWMNLHPTNVTQKVQFVIEHFAKNVAPLLGGRAKAMVVTSSRAAAVRYKLALDAYIATHPQHQHLKAVVAFSGKLSGKEVIHNSDATVRDDTFSIDEGAEFTETILNPDLPNSDLRVAFDRPEYRVMIVADKFQTGFDQPRLVAMYLDKKIANDVEIVQTLSRLNRKASGKDTTFVIDFVNNPDAVLAAFKKYDAGAKIEDVQDLNVVYTLQSKLDEMGIYRIEHLEAFRSARFKTIKDYAKAKATLHRELYAATQVPTDTFNGKVKNLSEALQACERAFENAKARGDEDGMKASDHRRKEHAEALKELLEFKSGLTRFSQTYAYVAQLIDFGDPELENFAAFAKLLAKRLDGVPRQEVDVDGLVLTGYDITAQPPPTPTGEDPTPPILKPIGPGGSGRPETPVYLRELITKLNSLFGDTAPLTDQAALVNQVVAIARENATVMAQVENNAEDVALQGSLKGTVEGAVSRAYTSHTALAKLLLQSDRQTMPAFTRLIYELLKAGQTINLDDLHG